MKLKHIAGALALPSVLIISLAAVRPATLPTPAPRHGVAPPDGKALYLKNCKQCHGVLGNPTKQALLDDDKIPKLSDPEFFKKRSDKALADTIKNGKGRNMKPFKDKMSDEEIEAVVQYIHTLAKASP